MSWLKYIIQFSEYKFLGCYKVLGCKEEYCIEFPGYNTIHPYAFINERCRPLPPAYNRPPHHRVLLVELVSCSDFTDMMRISKIKRREILKHLEWLVMSHSIHYEYVVPFGLTFGYARSAKLLFLGFARIIRPIFMGLTYLRYGYGRF
jgi:hypothetical protein